jgi:hypothetical protein
MLGRVYFARQATTLLKFARSTSNPELAASLVERAANLKAQIDKDDRPSPSPVAPDVEPERRLEGSAMSDGPMSDSLGNVKRPLTI